MTKKKLFWQYHVKAEGCSIQEHPDIINALMNLKDKLLSELRQCSFTAPKNFSVSKHKAILCHENKKSLYQITYTIGKPEPRQFFSLIWGLEFFQRSGHHMMPISWKAS